MAKNALNNKIFGIQIVLSGFYLYLKKKKFCPIFWADSLQKSVKFGPIWAIFYVSGRFLNKTLKNFQSLEKSALLAKIWYKHTTT